MPANKKTKFFKLLEAQNIRPMAVFKQIMEVGETITYNTIMNFKHGYSTATVRTVKKICRALSVLMNREVEIGEVI